QRSYIMSKQSPKDPSQDCTIEFSSGNVFADLGLPDADKLKLKNGLLIEIIETIKRLGITQKEAGRRMGISQSKVSWILQGDFKNLSEHKLMDCLTRLGYDIEVKVKRAKEDVGHMTVVIA